MARRALVTGAGGFIASHLAEALLTQGWDVTALVHYNARGTWGGLQHHHRSATPNLKVELGDITDPFLMMETVKNCDVVFHLAALIAIPYSYQAVASYVQTNVAGTLNIAQAVMKNGIARMVHTSTSEVYGTARYVPLDELHPLQAQSPYAASKIAADKIVESMVCAHGLPAVTVRPFNTYGPRQSARAVIPSIIVQALSAGASNWAHWIRCDLTFITDTVSGFIRAAQADGVMGETINLGTGEGVSIGELAKIIFDILGVSPKIVSDAQRVRPAASEVMQLVSNNSKAAKLLQWRPTVTLRDGLAGTIDWMRANLDLYRPQEYTR